MSPNQDLLPRSPPSKAFLKARWISQVKRDYFNNYIAPMPAVDVPLQDRPLYHRLLEQLYLRSTDADEKLQMMFAVVQREDVFRELIGLICLIHNQRELIKSSSKPRYIVTSQVLKNIARELQSILDHVAAAIDAYRDAVNGAREVSGRSPIPPFAGSARQQDVRKQPSEIISAPPSAAAVMDETESFREKARWSPAPTFPESQQPPQQSPEIVPTSRPAPEPMKVTGEIDSSMQMSDRSSTPSSVKQHRRRRASKQQQIVFSTPRVSEPLSASTAPVTGGAQSFKFKIVEPDEFQPGNGTKTTKWINIAFCPD